MSRRFSSIAVSIGVLLIAAGAQAAPATGPVDKHVDLERPIDSQKAKKKKPKKDVEAEEAAEAEEEEATQKKSKKGKGKKGKKDAEEAEEAEERPKKKGKKAKQEEVEEEPEEEPKKKKGKGKKGKKAEPPPEEEEVELQETDSPTAEGEPEATEEPLEEQPEEEESEESTEESAKAEESASVSSADLEGKIVLGVRLGFGLFLGATTGDEDAFAFSNKIPIWIDAGYKFTPNLMVGLYGQYAPAGVKDCYSNAECSAYVWRFGAQVQYEFSPDGTIDPWLGLGIGYEIAGATITVTGEDEDTGEPFTQEAKFELKGFEFANLQAGFDYKFSPTVGVGPFVSFSLGRYSSGEQTMSLEEGGSGAVSVTRSGEVTNKSMHEWFVIGVRGSFSL